MLDRRPARERRAKLMRDFVVVFLCFGAGLSLALAVLDSRAGDRDPVAHEPMAQPQLKERSMFEYNAEVRRVVDADTLDLLVDLGFGTYKLVRVRLARVDAWESRGKEKVKGKLATRFVIEVLTARGAVLNSDGIPSAFAKVRIETRKAGKFNRYIAEVYVPNGVDDFEINLGDQLIEFGHAVPYGTK